MIYEVVVLTSTDKALPGTKHAVLYSEDSLNDLRHCISSKYNTYILVTRHSCFDCRRLILRVR